MKRKPLDRATPGALAWQSKPRKPLAPRSPRPKRVQRAQEAAQHARQHHMAVRYCEASSYGVATPCGVGQEATLEHSHTIGKGMGGGKDYAVSDGECAILCRAHHRQIDTDRATMREAGLYKPRPPADLPPRRSE